MYPILESIRNRVSGIVDRPQYEVDGQVTREPSGFQWPTPVYNSSSPWPGASPSQNLGGIFGSLTRDDLHIILIGMFFLLALAIVTRK